MMQFNLLPHRMRRRQQQRQYLCAALLMFFFLGCGLSGIGWHRLVSQQDIAHKAIQTRQAASQALTIKIKAAAAIRAQTAALNADTERIDTLSRQRDRVVTLLRMLADQVPQGATLQRLRQQGAEFTLDGYATSNRDVAALLQNLNAQTHMVESALLLETRAADTTAKSLMFSVALVLKPTL
jgi:Tfp pilus assembly protein PilN